MVVAARPLIALCARDRRILELAARAPHGDFAAAVRELRAAVEAVIPGGRLFVIGGSAAAPVIGSRISRVGIVELARRIHVVRVGDDGVAAPLGRLWP